MTCDPDKGCTVVQIQGQKIEEHDRRLNLIDGRMWAILIGIILTLMTSVITLLK